MHTMSKDKKPTLKERAFEKLGLAQRLVSQSVCVSWLANVTVILSGLNIDLFSFVYIHGACYVLCV
jgi:hypothetical protein